MQSYISYDNLKYYISNSSGAYNLNIYKASSRCCKMIFDMSLNTIYFKFYENNWIIIYIDSKTIKNELNKINTIDMKELLIKEEKQENHVMLIIDENEKYKKIINILINHIMQFNYINCS